MLKKAIGLFVSIAIAMQSAALGAFGYDDTAADGVQKTAEITDEAEKTAIAENDPEYGKYLNSLERLEERKSQEKRTFMSVSSMFGEAGGGAMTIGYTNDTLIHASKFDGMDRVYGIDVSYFQHDIDWKKVKADGIDFAIIRVGYRGYGTGGQLVLDYKFKENIDEAIAAGLDVGVYFYTQAITKKEAVEEADFVYKYIKDYKLRLPVYFDIESVDYDVGRLDSAGLTKAEKTELCKAFCDRIKSYGFEAGVYSNPTWLNNYINGPELGKSYPIWLANYNIFATYYNTYHVWQFSSSGEVDGIDTAVDMNVWYREPQKFGVIKNLELVTNGGSAVLTWDKAADADRYEVYRYDPNKKTYTKIINTTRNRASFALTGSDCGYCVRARHSVGAKIEYGDYSETVYALANSVTGLTLSASRSSVTASWHPDLSARGYEVYYSVGGGGYTLAGETTQASYVINGLESAKKYSVKVRPYYSSGAARRYGSFCTPVEINTQAAPISAGVPTELYATVDPSKTKLTWNAVPNAVSYSVYKKSDGKYVKFAETKTCSYTVSNETSGTYAVTASVNSNGKTVTSGYSADCVVDSVAVNVPEINTYEYSSDGLTLKWNSADNASGYRIYKYDEAKKTYVSIKTINGQSASSYQVTGLENGQTYKFKIKAFRRLSSGILWTSASSAYKAYNGEDIVPDTPAITECAVSADSVTVSWTKIDNASGYRLYKYDEAAKTYKSVKTLNGADSLSYTVSGAAAGKFKVKAFIRLGSKVSWGKASSVYTV